MTVFIQHVYTETLSFWETFNLWCHPKVLGTRRNIRLGWHSAAPALDGHQCLWRWCWPAACHRAAAERIYFSSDLGPFVTAGPCFPPTSSGKEGKRKLFVTEKWTFMNSTKELPKLLLSSWSNAPSWEEFWASHWVGWGFFLANLHLKQEKVIPVLRCKMSFKCFALIFIHTRDTRILHNQHPNSFVGTTVPQKGQGLCDTDSTLLSPALPVELLSSLIPSKQQRVPA